MADFYTADLQDGQGDAVVVPVQLGASRLGPFAMLYGDDPFLELQSHRHAEASARLLQRRSGGMRQGACLSWTLLVCV